MTMLLRRFGAVLMALVLGGMSGWSDAQASTRIESISFDARADGQGYVVRIGASEHIKAYSMPEVVDGQRLTWTLFNTELDDTFKRRAPKGPVTSYEIAANEGHLTFRFALSSDRDVRAVAYRDRASDDVLLSITYAASGPTAQPVAQHDTPDVPDPSPVQAASASAGSLRAGARNAQGGRERWRFDTVVIDPGHGGRDPGAHAHGILEKDVVLDVAKILGGYLEEKLGVRVVYTRTDDRFLELEERGHIANEAGGKLFISLHVNASSASSVSGTETYFLGPHKTEAARKVMERENKVVRLESNPGQYEAYDEQALVRHVLTQSAYMRQSEKLGKAVQHQFDERVHRKSRGVKQAGFYVLWSASMPAILVELGFLTNPNEARFLTSENGKVYLASAIFRAVRNYKKEYEKGMNIARKE